MVTATARSKGEIPASGIEAALRRKIHTLPSLPNGDRSPHGQSPARHENDSDRAIPAVDAADLTRILVHAAPIALIDPEGTILWANSKSNRSLCARGLIEPSTNRISMPREETQPQFDSFVRAGGIAGRLIVPGNRAGEWVVIRMFDCGVGGRAARLLRFAFSAGETDCRANGIAELFALTPTETMVLDRFGSMCPAGQIAKDMGISLATVRSHLKRIYGKAGVHNGRELIRLVATFDMA